MTVKKTGNKKGGARKKTSQKGRALRQSGNGLVQSGNGFISKLLPGPLGQVASMVGLGRRRVQGGRGQDWRNYVEPIYSGLAPVIARDVVGKVPFFGREIPAAFANFTHGEIQKLLAPR